MLDSLVRVSRRVGGAADLLATEMPAARATRACCTSRLRYPPVAKTRDRGFKPQGEKLHPAQRSTTSGSSRPVPEKCSLRTSRPQRGVLADRTHHRPPFLWLESQGPASRAPPFTDAQFDVLLNSLFKVLFNFPSRYLFAIGLGVIFSLTWSLPRTLSCTPKQLDSRGKPAPHVDRLTGLSPSVGRGPSQGGLGPVVV